jgi:Tol biopolymer transport system component
MNPMKYARHLFVAAVLVAACILAAVADAHQAAFPGKNGRILFNDQNGYIDLMNANGTGIVRIAYVGANDTYIGAAWSPDGKQIAFTRSVSDPDIYTIRPDGSSLHEVTFSRGVDTDPTFSRDGTQIAFETDRNGNTDIYSINVDGSHSTQLTSSQLDEQDPSWSRQGKIAYTVVNDDGTKEIWVMNADGSGKKQLTHLPNLNENPNWSPDGRWIVFDSDNAETGNLDVYKMHGDGSGLTQLTDSPALDALPAFSPDGKKIVFVSDRAQKDSRKLFVMNTDGSSPTRLVTESGWTYQMVPDWQPVFAKDPCTIRGTINADHLLGTPGNDVICGLGGADVIEGGRGQDKLDGGAGNDRFYAKDGQPDTIIGGLGRDVAVVDQGLDKVVGVEKLTTK